MTMKNIPILVIRRVSKCKGIPVQGRYIYTYRCQINLYYVTLSYIPVQGRYIYTYRCQINLYYVTLSYTIHWLCIDSLRGCLVHCFRFRVAGGFAWGRHGGCTPRWRGGRWGPLWKWHDGWLSPWSSTWSVWFLDEAWISPYWIQGPGMHWPLLMISRYNMCVVYIFIIHHTVPRLELHFRVCFLGFSSESRWESIRQLRYCKQKNPKVP